MFLNAIFAENASKRLPWVPEDIFFLLCLVNAASPRTISVDRKKISSGTQGTKRPETRANNKEYNKAIW